ncbi:MAG TPA: hypothetical protein HA355_04525 [Methanosphaera sp.]|nr:hypothetical protein [Methanosphaera sp.]
MQKINKCLLLSSLSLIILLLLSSSVSAEDMSDYNVSSVDDSIGYPVLSQLGDGAVEDGCVLCSDSSNLLSEEIGPSENSLKETTEKCENSLNEPTEKSKESIHDSDVLKDSNDSNVYIVDSDNFTSYFVDGQLNEGFNDSIIILNGEFADMEIIDIKSSNVTIIGNNSLLINTVFCLESNNVMLTGLNFVLDQEFSSNDNAGILVLGNNCTIYNCTMDYNVPEATSGFCVYAEGNKIENFTLANSTFNFIGNNLHGGWDYCIFIDGVENAIVYGNNINCSLPLRSVNWQAEIFGGVSMDAVGAFVAQNSNNMTLSNNKISTYVNGGGNSYPTLDTVILYGCNNATVEKNRIHCEDFDSKDGKDNYLQGIDVYFGNDITILDNQIDMITTGGRAGMGTAYPIQVNGPSYNVKIAYNNLTTFNFGPNIGIYSQNYYGATKIDIISNFINVTGLASTHYWALVAGIEVQDSDDLILNNTIIVNNMGTYANNNNIYGISYSQNTNGNHTYNIQYNNVTTNGRYAVSLSGTSSLVVNSIIANNVLNTNKSSGNRAVRVGAGVNNTIRNNTDGVFRNTMGDDELPDWLKNHTSVVPNIFVPRYYREGSNGTGLTDDKGNGTAPWNTNGNIGGTNNGNGGTGFSGNGTNPNSDTVLGSNKDTSPGVGGDATPSISAASAGESGSSAADPNAYEINEQDNLTVKSVDYLQLGIICIVALLLLLVGYKRQKDKEEEE